MNSEVRAFVHKRIEELNAKEGLTMAEVSRQLGRNPTYIQQFVTKGIPKQFDEEDRRVLAAILHVKQEALIVPGRRRKHYKFSSLKTIEATLQQQQQQSLIAGNDASDHSPWKPAYYRMPVFQAAREESGVIVISSRPSSYIDMPSQLTPGQRGYTTFVRDDSMSPELKPGTQIGVDPDLEPKVGTTCLFRKVNGFEMTYRCLVGITDTAWTVQHHNGPEKKKIAELPRSDWVAHVIIAIFPDV